MTTSTTNLRAQPGFGSAEVHPRFRAEANPRPGSAEAHARPGSAGEKGMVTAEAALVLPMVAAFCLVLVWLVSVGVAQVQVVDAARDAARAIARGEDQDVAATAARRTAPDGSHVEFDASAEVVTVRVSVQATAPRWLLVPLPAIPVGSSSTVEVEGDVDTHL